LFGGDFVISLLGSYIVLEKLMTISPVSVLTNKLWNQSCSLTRGSDWNRAKNTWFSWQGKADRRKENKKLKIAKVVW